jgi:IS6 family transposase
MRPTSRSRGKWTYLYRAAGQHGQVIDVLLPARRNLAAAPSLLHPGYAGRRDPGRGHDRPRPMRGLKRHRSARILAAGHAFMQNLRRGHYDIATDVPARQRRLHIAFDDLAITI